jgi:hypothetical protein
VAGGPEGTLVAAIVNAVAKFSEIELAFDFVSSAAPSEHMAYLCIETGVCHWHTEVGDNEEALPDDIMDSAKYIEIPHKNDLGLGKRLALKFAAQVLPADYDEVAGIFRRRGAYGRFKNLLERRGRLEAWYEFENASRGAAFTLVVMTVSSKYSPVLSRLDVPAHPSKEANRKALIKVTSLLASLMAMLLIRY